MSLSSAMNAARSGLGVSTRWADSVSSNIANANNPSYARRQTPITTDANGLVRVPEITRAVDSSLDAMYRTEVSRTARQDATAAGLAEYTRLLGDTESTDTILTRFTALQSELSFLSVKPSDTSLQRSAVTAAEGLAASLNRAGSALDQSYAQAEKAVNSNVANANATLGRIAALSDKLSGGGNVGNSQLALQDQLNGELDGLAEIMDFTMRTDVIGRIEIFTTGGAELMVAGTPQPLTWDGKTGILRAGEVNITPDRRGARGSAEGALAGQVALVNTTLPRMQTQLDEVARALITAMVDADDTLGPDEAGLFTDAGQVLADDAAPGLAQRIAVNDAVRPKGGGEFWRIRDGIGATARGLAGDNSRIEAFVGALDGTFNFSPDAGLGEATTLTNYVSTLIASQNTTRANAESMAQSLASGALAVQDTRMSFMGVNIDDELQQLAAIQQSYSANAQVISSISEMIDTLIAAV